MDVVNHMPARYNLRPRAGQKKTRICIPSLPEEIIFKILLCLPAELIYNVMRFVCQEWYNVTKDPKFVDAHLLRSSDCILFQEASERIPVKCVEVAKHGLKVTDVIWLKKRQQIVSDFLPPVVCDLQFPGIILATCNGLVLFNDLVFIRFLYVANPITRQQISLPPLSNTRSNDYWIIRWSGLAYAASSRQYKVVHAYRKGKLKHQYFILTLGVDKSWRYLGKPEVRPDEEDALCPFANQPICIDGFIHWIFYPSVLSLDVETESFHVSTLPGSHEGGYGEALAMGSYLSFFLHCGGFEWDVWVLSELKKGVWTKLLKIDLVGHNRMLDRSLFVGQRRGIYPVAFLRSGELVIFVVSRLGQLLTYNVKTGAVTLTKEETGGYSVCRFLDHVKSLVSF